MRIADSSFLVGLFEEDDFHHQVAVTMLEDVLAFGEDTIVIGEAVVLETLQVMERRHNTPPAEAAVGLSRVFGVRPFRCDPAVLRALHVAAERPALGFVDALVAERAAQTGSGLLTFDAKLFIHANRLHSR
jgi:predicted nucleic acid-binding protein